MATKYKHAFASQSSLFTYLAEQVCQPDPPWSRAIPIKSVQGSKLMTLHRPDGLTFFESIPIVCTRWVRRILDHKIFPSCKTAALDYRNKQDFFILGSVRSGFRNRLSRWLEGDWYIILMVIGWLLVVIGCDWRDNHTTFIISPYASDWQVWDSDHSSGSRIYSKSLAIWMLYNTKSGKGVCGRIDGGWRYLFLEFYGRCVFDRLLARMDSRTSHVDIVTYWN